MIDIFGDRWYGELQWNNIPEQHELNNYIIKIHKEFGIGLISTADSHYPGPDAWKDRELYKRLGWLGKRPEYLSEELPEPEDLKCELYPKNGDQMWESYQRYSDLQGVEYDDDLVMNSITETHRIAFERIEDFMPDNEVRLPDFVVPEGATATQALARLSIDALRTMGLHENEEYIDRLKHELHTIDDRGFFKVFPDNEGNCRQGEQAHAHRTGTRLCCWLFGGLRLGNHAGRSIEVRASVCTILASRCNRLS